MEKLETKEGKQLVDTHRKSIAQLAEATLGDKSAVSKKIVDNAPAIAKVVVFIQLVIWPQVLELYRQARVLYHKAEPYIEKYDLVHLLPAALGLCLCFFGGTFPLVIAAGEAFKMAGWKSIKPALIELRGEAKKAIESERLDRTRDDDNDGVPDVQQVDNARALFQRKVLVVMAAIDPEVVQRALTALGAGLFAVIAALKMHFARSVALGASLADQLAPVLRRKVLPVVIEYVPTDYERWIPIVLDMLAKLIAVSFAFMIQRVISAFHSGVRGGLMAGRGILRYLDHMKVISFNEEESMLDETVGYALAGLGVFFQITSGFQVSFPLSFFLLPVSMAETWLAWGITFA